MTDLNMFIPITKVDEEKRLVYGVVTAESPDKSGEICDYESTVPHYKSWSAEFAKVTDGKSLGNIRAMHGKVAVGKAIDLTFDDENKRIMVCAKIVDDNEWKKCLDGVYTGFSQGGSYVKRWDDSDDPALKRYTAKPTEISLVDVPCLPIATFEYVKSDGSVEMRKFHALESVENLVKMDIVTVAHGVAVLKGQPSSQWTDFVTEVCDTFLAQDVEEVVEKYSDEQSRDDKGRWTSSLAGQVAGGVTGVVVGRKIGQTIGSYAGGFAGSVAGTASTVNPLGGLAGSLVGSEVGSTVGGAIGAAVGGVVGAHAGGRILATDEKKKKEEKKKAALAAAKESTAKKIADAIVDAKDSLKIDKAFWNEALHPRDASGKFGSGGGSAKASILGRATKAALSGAASLLTSASKSDLAVSAVKAVVGYAIKTAIAEAIAHSFVSGLKWAGVQVSDTTATLIRTVVGVATHATKSASSEDDKKVLAAAARDLPDVVNLVCDTIKSQVVGSDEISDTTKKEILAAIEDNRQNYLSNVSNLGKSHDEGQTMTKDATPMVTNDQVIEKANELAEAAGDPMAWPTHIEAARDALEKAAAGGNAPGAATELSATTSTEPTVEKKADAEASQTEVIKKKADTEPQKDAEDMGVRQVWLAKDGSTHQKKADALAKNAQIETNKTKSPIEAALSKIDAVLKPTEGQTSEVTEKAAAIAELRKYLGEEVYDASLAVSALSQIFGLLRSEIAEAESNPEQVSALQDSANRLNDFIVSEIQEDNSSVMAMAAKMGDLAKSLEKSGARHSAQDFAYIQQIHDICCSLGHDCGDASAEKSEQTGGLSKVTAENETLKKTIADLAPRLEEISILVKAQADEITALKKQPVPPPVLRAVNKGGDVVFSAGDAVDEDLTKKLAALSPEQKAELFVKLSQQNPLNMIQKG